jgi:hypothetical protein
MKRPDITIQTTNKLCQLMEARSRVRRLEAEYAALEREEKEYVAALARMLQVETQAEAI